MVSVNVHSYGMHSIPELEVYQQMTLEEWLAVRRIETCRCGGRVTTTTWTVDLLSGWYNYCVECDAPATDPKTNLREYSNTPTGSVSISDGNVWGYTTDYDMSAAYTTVSYYNPDAPRTRGISNTRSISYEIVPEGAIE